MNEQSYQQVIPPPPPPPNSLIINKLKWHFSGIFKVRALLWLFLCANTLQAQGNDTVLYTAPNWHESITNIPGDFATAGKTLFSTKSIVPLGIIAGSTAVLYLLDKPLVDGVQQFSRYIGLDRTNKFEPVIQIGDVKVMERPGNLNTGFYFIGEGWTSILIFGGIGIHGAVTDNTREVRMLSQALEGWIEIGVVCQLLKRSFGRETPQQATTDRGTFRPFPALSDYQKQVSKYDALPSGHMATMAFTITLLAEHYPDNRLIRPVGYSLIGICALSMLNNGVHWASDYPLGFGIGYLFAKIVAQRGRVLQSGATSNSLLNRMDVSPTILFDGYSGGSAGLKLSLTL
ncbi:phosphoesterase, PA-phosphatase related [Candidatus Symbiothrix dinenymphae]|nr:phosphoesterase, PA-phosphatase related [Candidatus Symbiothrix dinenymphae]